MKRTLISSVLAISMALGGCGSPRQEPICPEGTFYEADDGECETLVDAMDLDDLRTVKPGSKPTAKPTAKPSKPVVKPAPSKPSKPSSPKRKK